MDTRYQIHVYQTNEAAFCTNDWEEEDTVTAKHWTLPNKEFDGWFFLYKSLLNRLNWIENLSLIL